MIKDFDFISTCDISGFVKEETRSIVLYKSDISYDDIVLDINAGIGEISAEFSRLAKEVCCIDEDMTAIEYSKRNIRKHGDIDRVRFLNKDALSAIEEIEEFDVAVLKLKDDNIEETIEKIHSRINSRGRIIIITNILDYALSSVDALSELYYNPEITQVNISKGQMMRKGVKLFSENPVIIINVKKR